MKDPSKTNQELLDEISTLNQRIQELEISEAEHKRAEEAHRASELRYQTIFETTGTTMLIVEEDMTISLTNDKWGNLTGYAREEVEGKRKWTEFVEKSDLEKMIAQHKLRRVDPGLATKSYEFRLIHRDGHIKHILLTVALIPGTKKSVASLIDITERKEAEATITRERQKLKTFSDNAPFGMLLIDKEGHFTYINRKFTELFGRDLSDIPDGRTWFRKAYPDTECRRTAISAWKEDSKDAKPGERKPNIFTVTCKDGTQKIVKFIFSILVSGDYLMACEDITELRQLENQLRQAQKTEAIGTLTGSIAHDFNNILTALMGYAFLMQKKMDKDSPLRSYLDQILSASKKATDLIQALLAFNRQQPVTLTPLDMNNTIKATEKLLRRLLTENIEFRTFLTDDGTIIMADKSQMDQIFFNLVTNARDAMPKGGTLIIETGIADMDARFIRAHRFGKTGRYVLITVSDTGEGMDETIREKIFDPFFTTKEAGKGTGLGLATVYGIVKQHNGYITVKSEPNQGTTFSIYFPAARMKVNEEQDMVTSNVTGNETILIAEDDDEVRHLVREALEAYDYKIIEAIDGEDAVEKFKQNRDTDLVIIDSVMPKKNGREAYEEIRKIAPHVKVIFTSGYTKDIVLNKGIEDGEFDFIAKPLSLDELLGKIRQALDKQ